MPSQIVSVKCGQIAKGMEMATNLGWLEKMDGQDNKNLVVML